MAKYSYVKALAKFSDQQNWYTDIHDYIFSSYECPYLFCGLLASTSPRMSVKKSWNLSVELYDRIMEGQTDFDWKFFGMLPAQYMNVERLLRGEKLSGPKVTAFFANLIGDYDQVTIDTWMIVFFKFDKCLTKNRYKMLADRIRNYAKKVGMTPAGLQAVLWSWIRDEHNKSHSSYIKSAEITIMEGN